MDDNHKIPAFLPHKLVKALAEYLDFKPDGTAQFGKDLEVDGNIISLNGGFLKIQSITDIKKVEDYTLGLYFINDESAYSYVVIGYTILDENILKVCGWVIDSESNIYWCDDNHAITVDSSLIVDVSNAYNIYQLIMEKYTHTVTITQTSSGKTFSFTAENVTTNLKVDSLQDLKTVFGGEKHAGSGTLGSLLDTHPALPSDYTIDGVKIGACTIEDDVFLPH